MSSRAVTIIGVGAGAGYAGYWASQYKEVAKFESEEKNAQKLVEAEATKLKAINKSLGEQEKQRNTLTVNMKTHQQAVEMVQVQLDEARKQVEILEQQFHSKQEAVTKVAKELEAAEAKISTLKRDVLRTSEAMSLGEKSMHLARNQAAEARKTLYNPLHHPKVKSLLGK